jgi:hypothetical protein
MRDSLRGKMESELIPPSINLLESMRSVGYSFEAAIADLIDNSISAGARHIAIDADVVDGKYLAILDDGCGMTSVAAREALRLAGSIGDHVDSDLGRFGLGLKTASLSQARCLTVVTKQADTVTALRWDIDFVREKGQWFLLVLDETALSDLPLWALFDAQPAGTLVLWDKLDLLLGDTNSPGTFLAEQLGGVRSSLALVFHRFLADRRERLTITINGIGLRPMDPFLTDNPKTQPTATETIPIGDAAVEVTAFTLPHPSSLTPEERQRPDLSEGMREAQGFYIYRNCRLISRGHWYGLTRMDELSKQTRIRVDIPTSLDGLWQLDIKKSRAEPPQSFKQHLRRIIEPIIDKGRRVHRFRGRRDGDMVVAHVWNKLKTREGFAYEVNLDNPLIESVLSRLDSTDAKQVVKLLQVVASTYPVQDAYNEVAQNIPPAQREVDRADVIDRLRDIRDSGLLSSDHGAVALVLARTEPFNQVSGLEELVEEVWGHNDGTK